MADVGRPKAISTPEDMAIHFEAYRTECKSKPILVHDFVGKEGRSDEREKERPLTYEGFCNWLYYNNIIKNPEHYFSNLDNRYDEFVEVCTRIKATIRQDHIEGGMAGIYNPSITQRLNGLKEATDVTTNGKDVNAGIIVQSQADKENIEKIQ